jgi:ankyrin repeat protein
MATTQSSTSSNSSSAYTPTTSRYPVHDACEFEDASVLRSLIFVPQSDCDSSDEDEMEDEDDSSSDDGGEASHAQMAYAAAVGRSPVLAAVGGVADLGHSTAAGGAAAGGDVATGGEGEQAASSDNMQIDRETNGNNNAAIENKEGSSKQVSPELLNNQSAVAATNGKEKDNKRSSSKQKRIKYSCPYDLDDRDDDDNTPLHIAIHARKLQHIRLLLEAGASIHRKCDGSAPIHLCIAIGAIGQHAPFAVECCQLLLSYGADVTMRDDSFHNPLYLGCTSNLGAVVELLLRDKRVADAVNFKADRVGGRALHAAARYDVGSRRGVAKGGVIPEHQQQQQQKSVTELLLGVEGIEVDAQNNYGRTPLHIAACRGNWNVARLLIQAGADVTIIDKRGFTPGQVARKRGMVLPNDLLVMNQDCQAVVHTRDLIMDPDRTTLILCHELCIQHKTCPPIVRGDAAASEPPPENVRRLTVLINDDDGILRCDEFSTCKWNTDVRRAAMTDVLKVHEYTYIEKTSQLCAAIPDHPNAIQTLDADTTVSHWSFEAALRAAGSVCEAVDKVMSEEFRNAFCAIRPPGHHAGPRGIVTCPNDPDGSHGFCLLNNVAIGAAYARSMYRNDGIKKVAIIDFDVHHGNGTEEIVRQLTPNVEQHMIRTPFAVGGLSTSSYKPWLDEKRC